MTKSEFGDDGPAASAEVSWVERAAPWAAGAGIALGHIAVSSNCSIPTQGRCGACGSCIVAVGSLVAWALIKQRQGGDFFEEISTRRD